MRNGEQKMTGAERIAHRIHVLTFAVYILTIGYAYHALAPFASPFKSRISGYLFALPVIVWVAAYIWRHVRARYIFETERFSRSFYLCHMWLYNLAIIAGFWILIPQADDATYLLCVMFTMGAIAVEAFATAEAYATNWLSRSLPYGPSVAICAYSIVYGGRFSWIIVAFIITFTALIMMFRKALEIFMGQRIQANLATKLALDEVAAERDAKVHFLASASHDLGQPLQSARLFFDQAIRSTDEVARKKAVAGVNWAFDATEHILRQMLDHLKLGSGAVTANISTVAVGPLLSQIAETYEPASHLASVSIHALPCRWEVRADAILIERALGNLVSNAIHHAKARRILIGGQMRDQNIRIWVIDDGVGIAEADLPRLFDDYTQGSDHGDEIRGGFGLGLASVRQITKLLGGITGIDRRWVRGSAFFLEFPRANTVAQ